MLRRGGPRELHITKGSKSQIMHGIYLYSFWGADAMVTKLKKIPEAIQYRNLDRKII
jgi:hypothetical protein